MSLALPVWLAVAGEGVVLTLHVQPGARHSELAGVHGDALKLRISAPPVDGKANEAVLAFVAARLGVPRQMVCLVAGASARRKRVRVDGVSSADAVAALA